MVETDSPESAAAADAGCLATAAAVRDDVAALEGESTDLDLHLLADSSATTAVALDQFGSAVGTRYKQGAVAVRRACLEALDCP